MPLFPLQSSSFYSISFMAFSAVLTLVKLLVLCTGSTVRRESCSPVSSAGWALPWLAQRRCCKGWAHQESLATTLDSAVCLSPQLLSKTHCGKNPRGLQAKPDLITHNRGSGFQSRFEIVGIAGRQRHWDMKQHVFLANLEGSHVPPVLSNKPHTHPLLLWQSPCCGFG